MKYSREEISDFLNSDQKHIMLALIAEHVGTIAGKFLLENLEPGNEAPFLAKRHELEGVRKFFASFREKIEKEKTDGR